MNFIKLSNLNFDPRYVTWKFNENDMFLYTNRPLFF